MNYKKISVREKTTVELDWTKGNQPQRHSAKSSAGQWNMLVAKNLKILNLVVEHVLLYSVMGIQLT